MSCDKCGSGKAKGLCPVSLGLALGLTSGLAVLIWSLWVMFYGMPPAMAAAMPELTWSGSALHALMAFVKGFVFGFVVAAIYDFCICCCKMKCCKSDCKCACCNGSNK